MFDATKGNKQVTDQVDELTDEFAARFGDLSPRMQAKVASKLNELLDDPDSIDEFAAGQYAQNSQGQPAQALGSGSSGQGGSQPSDTQSALAVIANDPRFSGLAVMLQRAALGLQNPGNPSGLEFDQHGDDKRLAQLRQELGRVENERDSARDDLADERDPSRASSLAAKKAKAEQDLADERDPNKSGSLAEQLAAAQGGSTDLMPKADVVQFLEELHNDIGGLTSPTVGNKVQGKKAVSDKVQAAIDYLS